MSARYGNVVTLLRKPSGYLPLIMSGLALALLVGFIAVGLASGGIERAEDEGFGAHLYQLLIGLQVFPIGWFALRWGVNAPLVALAVIALQIAAIAVTLVPLWWFGL